MENENWPVFSGQEWVRTSNVSDFKSKERESYNTEFSIGESEYWIK